MKFILEIKLDDLHQAILIDTNLAHGYLNDFLDKNNRSHKLEVFIVKIVDEGLKK